MINKNLQSAGFAEILQLQAQVQELNKAIVDFDSNIDKTKKFLAAEVINIRKILAVENQSTVSNKEFEHKEAIKWLAKNPLL